MPDFRISRIKNMEMKFEKNHAASFIEICIVLRMAWAKSVFPAHPSIVIIGNFIKYICSSESSFMTALNKTCISTTVTNNARLFNF